MILEDEAATVAVGEALAKVLRAGDVVMAGALTRMVPARPGDRFRAEFAHLGAVSVRFGAP